MVPISKSEEDPKMNEEVKAVGYQEPDDYGFIVSPETGKLIEVLNGVEYIVRYISEHHPTDIDIRIKVTDLKDIVLSIIGDSMVKNLAESSELVI